MLSLTVLVLVVFLVESCNAFILCSFKYAFRGGGCHPSSGHNELQKKREIMGFDFVALVFLVILWCCLL